MVKTESLTTFTDDEMKTLRHFIATGDDDILDKVMYAAGLATVLEEALRRFEETETYPTESFLIPSVVNLIYRFSIEAYKNFHTEFNAIAALCAKKRAERRNKSDEGEGFGNE